MNIIMDGNNKNHLPRPFWVSYYKARSFLSFAFFSSSHMMFIDNITTFRIHCQYNLFDTFSSSKLYAEGGQAFGNGMEEPIRLLRAIGLVVTTTSGYRYFINTLCASLTLWLYLSNYVKTKLKICLPIMRICLTAVDRQVPQLRRVEYIR